MKGRRQYSPPTPLAVPARSSSFSGCPPHPLAPRGPRARVEEDHAAERVVGRDGEEVFVAGEDLEAAVHQDAVGVRTGPAELEAAERGEAAGEEGVVDRRLVARVALVVVEAQHLPAGSVGMLGDDGVLPRVGLGMLEDAGHLFQRRFQGVPLRGQESVIAGHPLTTQPLGCMAAIDRPGRALLRARHPARVSLE